MSKTKKQHYVPQFLLRNWSKDETTINLYQLDNNKTIDNVPIKGQAQEHYFYGEDQRIENLFGSLETETATVIKKILLEDLSLSMEEKRCIYHFVAVQNIRTPSTITMLDDNATVMARNLLKLSNKFKDKEDLIDKTDVKVNNKPIWQLMMYLQSVPALFDLKLILLKANTQNMFMIGQNPIVVLNPYLIEKKWPESKKGLGMKGVFIVFPISPMYSICLYDKSVYSLTEKSKIISLSDDEIDICNKFQFLTTNNCIYYNEWFEKFRLFNIETEPYRKKEKVFIQNFQNIENKRDVLSVMSSLGFPLEPKFKFLGIKQYAYFLQLNKQSVTRQEAIKSLEWAKEYYKSFPGMEKMFK